MMALPIVVACVVGVVMIGYTVVALGAVGDFQDPHDWEDEDEEE